jgi:hypothetical protein
MHDATIIKGTLFAGKLASRDEDDDMYTTVKGLQKR